MLGIKDVAKKAGFSISTVSYALNGSSRISEETRQIILKVADEMGYVPNGAAKLMRRTATKIVGVYLGAYSGPFYGPLLEGMKENLNKLNYELVVCSGAHSHRLLLEKILDGAIVLDQSFTDRELMNYADRGHKIVTLDRKLSHNNISTILLDNEQGAKLAIQNLMLHEMKEIFVVTGPAVSYDSNQRLTGVTNSLKNHPEIKKIFIVGDFTKESGTLAAKRILSDHSIPLAVFCLNDEMAIGFYDYVKTTDYQIGKDIFLVGFDNIELSAYVEPRLTTIDYSTFQWGVEATDSLVKLLNGEPGTNVEISVELIKGKSS